jgi:multimeric flavodoxin WrbA
MQNAFVLTGSPRKDGVTARMAALFAEKWKNAVPGNETVFVNAYQTAVKPCIHCGGCRKSPSCVYDDYTAFDTGFKTADVLVVAAPVYGLGFPAPLKAVLDRTQQYFEAKFSRGINPPLAKHKKALLLAATGSPDTRGVSFIKEELALVCKLINADLCGVVFVSNTDRAIPDYVRIAGEIGDFIESKLGHE